MKNRLVAGVLMLLSAGVVAPLHAAEAARPSWHAENLGQAVGYMILFAAIVGGAVILGVSIIIAAAMLG